MTKTKLKALTIFLVVAVLLATLFVANYSFVQRAFAEEAPDSEVDSGYTLPEVEETDGDGEEGLTLFGMNLVTLIIIGVVFVFVIFPGIILGIVVSAMRSRRR
ncbi:MAG: hypothetical protein J1F65_01610 [Clostridiales bacterium]|nr:hypothetical protein [Clostridiales bacterium]